MQSKPTAQFISTGIAGIAAALLLATSAQATLLGRDIGGNAVAGSDSSSVFLYDTELNVTWLRNANAASGSAGISWNDANAWAANLTIGGFSNWRLPTMVDTGTPGCNQSFVGTDCGYNPDTIGNEIAHLYFVTLGNKSYCDPIGSTVSFCNGEQVGYGDLQSGDFQNLGVHYSYWFGLEYAPNPDEAWFLNMFEGAQAFQTKSVSSTIYGQYGALAVHDGDVLRTATPPNGVPEPATLLLTAVALLGLGVARRKWSLPPSRA